MTSDNMTNADKKLEDLKKDLSRIMFELDVLYPEMTVRAEVSQNQSDIQKATGIGMAVTAVGMACNCLD